MNPQVQDRLTAYFRHELERLLPVFEPVVLPETSYFPWRWQIAPKLVFFIGLSPMEDYDEFVIDIAWSDDGEVPWSAYGGFDPDAQKRCRRLSRLWMTGQDEYIWDLAPEIAAANAAYFKAMDRGKLLPFVRDPPVELVLTRVEPLADDAIQKLIQYGIPLFRRVAEHRGAKWPDSIPTKAQVGASKIPSQKRKGRKGKSNSAGG
jgi:hypothetical protein